MSKLDKDEVIAAFSAAYEAANGKAPQIEAKGGWYSVDGGKNVRLAALADMTAELGTPAAAPKKAPAKKPAKKAAKKPAAAPAASTGPKVVSVGDGMKPADYWQAQIAS